jgi:thiosulfate reductase cytochrome b subunit
MRRLVWALMLAAAMIRDAGAGVGSNPIHPTFVPLDGAGAPVIKSRNAVSQEKTCGQCHDMDYIAEHNTHGQTGASCTDCHGGGGEFEVKPHMLRPDGTMIREFIRISSPKNTDCAMCHGIIHAGPEPFAPPSDYASSSSYDITMKTGAVLSQQRLSGSLMNLAGRDSITNPWDVHMARALDCTGCHYSRNNPIRTGSKNSHLGTLTFDPRKQGFSDFLLKPDHVLATADCHNCHDPMTMHFSLPFKERHMQVLDCRSCHVFKAFGPARETVDETVVDRKGNAVIHYRGYESPGGSLAGSYNRGYLPFLMPVEKEGRNDALLAPFNMITRFFWVSGDGRAVPDQVVKEAFLDEGKYRPEMILAFDADRDGAVSAVELRIDTGQKYAAVRSRLQALGTADPFIKGEVSAYKVSHGVMEGKETAQECSLCHHANPRIVADVELAPFTPASYKIDMPKGTNPVMGTNLYSENGRLMMKRPQASGLYILGHARDIGTDLLGFIFLVFTLLGAVGHAVLRWYFNRGRSKAHVETRKVYTFTLYERIWHWLMATTVTVLIVTGIGIHWAGKYYFMPLPQMVSLHNFVSALMVVNAGLALFYHLASAAIFKFIPNRANLLRRMTEQISYYSRGIFFGARHPAGEPGHVLNPLQQITYLVLLNVLFPLQIVTGLLMYGASKWQEFSAAVGGLEFIAPAHNMGSWLFISFYILHLYLTTTGHTVTSNIKAMVTGWHDEEIHQEHGKEKTGK